ncbi:MAG: hypothetical protein PHP08_00895 [Candidatus Dojkabacteria bacterium]|nr:hypothetical protein [Candidatus Dojkabacteria bacterium]
MAKLVEEIKLAQRGGEGFGVVDDSENLNDMRYAEKLIFYGKVGDMSFFEALATLKVAEKVTEDDGSETLKGGAILLERSDIPGNPVNAKTGKPIGITGICQRIDSEFVALEIPFKSQAHTSDEARLANKDKPAKERQADMIKIYRISKEFDIDNYAASASKRCLPRKEIQEVEVDGKVVKKEVEVAGSTDYNEPTPGQRLRAARWLRENGEDIVDTLEAIGLSFE